MAGILPASFVDSHCHLNLDEFDNDRTLVVSRARAHGLSRILVPGIDVETSKSAIQCAAEYAEVYAAVGVHPNNGQSWEAGTVSELKLLVADKKVVAIGEIGLDYYRDYCPKDTQRTILQLQLELAAETNLPVVIHFRDAEQDTIDILEDWHHGLESSASKLALRPGVLHSFSGGISMAEKMAALHFKLGISGPITYKNSATLRTVVTEFPLNAFLIETDAPFLSPQPFRAKRNEPTNVRIVAEKIAELKAIPVEQVAKITTQEAGQLFEWREID